MKRTRRKMKRAMRQAVSGIILLLLLGVMALVRGLSGNPGETPTASPSDGRETSAAVPDELAVTPPPTGEMEVHFLDVGQGDCTLIRCDNQVLLIDTGEGDKGADIQNYLTKQGIEKLDYLILTHPDADHIGSAADIIGEFEIGQVFISNFEKDNQTYRKMIQALDDKNLSPLVPEVGSAYWLGSAKFTILAPNRTYSDPNNASLALRIEREEISFLFTGDAAEAAEADILENGEEIEVDVYQVGHHGSRTSSGVDFLEKMVPTYAVISCEEGNSYGHPHAQTLNSLRMMGVKVFRTDEQGTIVAVTDGTEITWNCPPSDSWIAGEPTGTR